MGDVLTYLSEERGSITLSKAKLPFSEAKVCTDYNCMFYPCDAMRMTLTRDGLLVNGKESMLIHLSESKKSWQRLALNPWEVDLRNVTVDDIGAVSGYSARDIKFFRHRAAGKRANSIKYGNHSLTIHIMK